MTDTDFGTENVRSNPGTRRGWLLSVEPFGVSPVPGARPASTDLRSRVQLWSILGDLHDIVAKLLRIGLGHGVILPGPPVAQAK